MYKQLCIYIHHMHITLSHTCEALLLWASQGCRCARCVALTMVWQCNTQSVISHIDFEGSAFPCVCGAILLGAPVPPSRSWGHCGAQTRVAWPLCPDTTKECACVCTFSLQIRAVLYVLVCTLTLSIMMGIILYLFTRVSVTHCQASLLRVWEELAGDSHLTKLL